MTKDVGMIPYILHKYYSYNSTMLCYKNDEDYPYLEKEVKGLKIDFIKPYTKKSTYDALIYLIKNSRKIDVLQLFHLARRNFLWIAVYLLLNPKGKVYIKLDANLTILNYKLSSDTILERIKIKLLKKCKLISVETYDLYNYLNDNWPVKVEYIPNGFYECEEKQTVHYDEKENVICTVGRIGTYEKASEILLKGFREAAEYIPGWKLKVIGPIEKEFQIYIDNFFAENPSLKERIIFTGNIIDKEVLNKEYINSKIFCLTSRTEGFPLVYLEAIKNGCYIITSNVTSAKDITMDRKYGDIFEVDNYKELASILIKTCNNEQKLNELCEPIQKFAYEKFNWVSICEKINNYLF